MQRVRIGLTGLAVVFLLVLLTASLLAFSGRNGGPAASQATTGTAVMAGEEPKEPLAEIGLAPGAAPEAPASDNAQAPAPR
jgi:hypothetical protein